MAAKPDYTKYAGWTRGEMIRTIEALMTRQTDLLNHIARLEMAAGGPLRGPSAYDAGSDPYGTIAVLPDFWLDGTPVRYPWENDDGK